MFLSAVLDYCYFPTMSGRKKTTNQTGNEEIKTVISPGKYRSGTLET